MATKVQRKKNEHQLTARMIAAYDSRNDHVKATFAVGAMLAILLVIYAMIHKVPTQNFVYATRIANVLGVDMKDSVHPCTDPFGRINPLEAQVYVNDDKSCFSWAGFAMKDYDADEGFYLHMFMDDYGLIHYTVTDEMHIQELLPGFANNITKQQFEDLRAINVPSNIK